MESCCSRNSVPPLSLNWPDVLASFLVLCGRTAMSRSGRATDAEDSTMTDIKRIVPGKRMSQAVACGNLVFLAGQVAQRAGGAAVAEQTKDILARIEELLADAGSDKTKLLSATIWQIGKAPGRDRG